MTQVAEVFSNRYEIERPIARGGMADVYLARDQFLDRPVAVKVLFPEYARDPSFVERFRREAQNAAGLNHPNIVAVYDYGQERGTYFIVMEFVQGKSLRDIVRAEGRLPAMQAARIASEIAAGLDFAHRHGVVHRDIKPGNVLLTPQGQVKVADFGIAANPTDTKAGLTQTGAVIGTATYFSPEQAQGYQVDGRTDVYALGVVLYEMLTGRPPFSAESPVAIAMKHVREQPVPPTQLVADIPPELETVVLKALSKDVATRYQSAEEMRADLMRFGRGQPVTANVVPMATATEAPTQMATNRSRRVAPPPPSDEMWDEEPRRRYGPIVATVIGIGLLAAVIIYAVFFLGGKDDGGTDVEKVEVPEVVGTKFVDAQAALTNLGFKVRRVDQVSSDEIETVIDQDPEGGLLFAKGRTIVLTVSASQVDVPNLVGQTKEQAQTALTELGLVYAEVPQETPDQPAGTVLGTNPPAGTKVDKGTTVGVVVAAEPPIDIPDVDGQDQVAAQQVLTAAGFGVTVVPTPSETVAAGKVISTTPAGGTKALKGTTVAMNVSTGPTSVAVPNTTGQSCNAGASQLAAAGFNVTINGNAAGTVTSQNPAGGTAPPGSAVSLACT